MENKSSTFKVGQRVLIKKFNRDGYITEILEKDQFKVTLGSIYVTLSSVELELKLDNAPVDRSRHRTGVTIVAQSTSKENEELDLHGFTVNAAVEALENKLNRAIMTNLKRLKVVHGFGTGKVMQAVHQYLSSSSLVANFRVDDLNPGQTWVYLS